MRRWSWLAAALLGALGCSGSMGKTALVDAKSAVVEAPDDAAGETAAATATLPGAEDRLAVPGFGGATGWLNVDHPLTLEELQIGRAHV